MGNVDQVVSELRNGIRVLKVARSIDGFYGFWLRSISGRWLEMVAHTPARLSSYFNLGFFWASEGIGERPFHFSDGCDEAGNVATVR